MKDLILKITYKIWHRAICRILSRAKEEGVINSAQWHTLGALFDKTQKNSFRLWGKNKNYNIKKEGAE